VTDRDARLAEIEVLAWELMDQWGLVAAGWTFRFNDRERALGLCWHLRPDGKPLRRIELSRHMANAPDAEVRDTILHEIAHAKAGPGAGHGRLWKTWCRTVGARPEARCKEADFMPKGRFMAICTLCHKTYYKRRKPALKPGRYFVCRCKGVLSPWADAG
jgi:predicted SprT family Zn-dependent metalloprotease